MTALPIDEVLPALRAAPAAHRAVVLQAPPGAGKATGVPIALLQEPWLAGSTILILEPRRLAARMGQLRGEAVGETVGYCIRFDARVSKRTRIEVLTEGILTRRLQPDLALEGVELVIFDEFHERYLRADLALALCVDAQRGLREDLKILDMSATLDGEALSRLLDGAPIVTSRGRSNPAEIVYAPRDPEGPLPQVAAAAVRARSRCTRAMCSCSCRAPRKFAARRSCSPPRSSPMRWNCFPSTATCRGSSRTAPSGRSPASARWCSPRRSPRPASRSKVCGW
jgi:ATP-dependent helicase HrpB